MRDAISIGRVKLLHPKVRDEVFQTIGEIEAQWPDNVLIRVVQGLRTIEEQDALYALGRTKVNPVGITKKKPKGNIVTKARGGSSYHNYGTAFDFCLLYDKNKNLSFETISWDVNDPHWMEVVNAFRAKGWFWGGDWATIRDFPHLQKTFGKTVKQLFKMYKAGQYVEL